MTEPSRTPELDGLRAFAVLAVIVEHAFGIRWAQTRFETWSPGNVGVRLFFVLSGFLITGILLSGRRDAEDTGASKRSVWTAFYLRRSLRIFPLAYAAIALACIAGAPTIRQHLGWYVTYTENFLFARQYSFEPPLSHFWSLAVEEQFYLIWPVVMLLVPETWLLPLILCSIGGAMLSRCLLLRR
jgi:peptidoglycan/LPS O-acetylase OafA/YrhL